MWTFRKEHTSSRRPVPLRLYGGRIEVRLDSVNGAMAGVVTVPNTKFQYRHFTCTLTGAKGVHDLYLVFRGGERQKHNLFNFDWWQMR